jgi:hypothetical protein
MVNQQTIVEFIFIWYAFFAEGGIHVYPGKICGFGSTILFRMMYTDEITNKEISVELRKIIGTS